MKVLFIVPPHPTRKNQINDGMPLGILYLASMIRKEHEIHIIDYYSFPQKHNLIKILSEMKPDVVAVSIPFKLVEKSAKKICQIVRDETDSVIIIGGIHATLAHYRTRQTIDHDFFISGEAEIPFQNLISFINSRGCDLPNNVFTPEMDLKPVPITSDDINLLPFPSRDLLPNRNLYMERIITSRGCGFGCKFCSSKGFWGGFRGRDPDLIIDELESIYAERGKVPVSFADDSFTYDRARVEIFCERMKERNIHTSGLGFSSHPERLDEDILLKMRQVGFNSIFLGLESGSKRILETIGKNYNRDRISNLINYGLSLGYEIHASFMIGLPGETGDDVKETIAWAEELPLKSIGFHIFYPFDGCSIRENSEKYGIIINERPEHDGDIDGEAVVHTGVMSSDEILDFYYRARALAKKKSLSKA